MKTLKIFNSLVVLGLLAGAGVPALQGCKTTETTEAASLSYWQDMYQRLGELENFTLGGKINVSVSGKNLSTGFKFSGDDDEYTLSIDSPLPLGGSLASITASESSFSANIAGKTYETGLAETLVSKLTGISIPVQNLREVLLGMPDGVNETEEDRIVSSRYMNCQIKYGESAMLGGYALPSTVEITGYGATGKIELESFSAD